MLYNDYNIEKIGLFGSFAKGEQKATSDIDIVFHLKEGASLQYKHYVDIEELFEQKFNLRVDLVNYNYMNPIIKISCKDFIEYV